jgi:hypothetical protein
MATSGKVHHSPAFDIGGHQNNEENVGSTSLIVVSIGDRDAKARFKLSVLDCATQASELLVDSNSTWGWGGKTSTIQTRKSTLWTIASWSFVSRHR